MTGLYFGPGVRRNLFALILSAGSLSASSLVGGCGTVLEDGYKPRVLGATPEVRKSYYASPFTAQAEAGAQKEAAPAVHSGPR